MTEKQWTANVLELCRMFGWHAIHQIPLRTKHGWRTGVQGSGAVGFPDVLACRPPRLVAAELKIGNRQPDGDQLYWLEMLERSGCEIFVWYPDDVDQVAEVLR